MEHRLETINYSQINNSMNTESIEQELADFLHEKSQEMERVQRMNRIHAQAPKVYESKILQSGESVTVWEKSRENRVI